MNSNSNKQATKDYTAQKKPKSVSLITQLISSFLVVSLILVGVVTGVFLLASYLSSDKSVRLSRTDIGDFEDILQTKTFSNLPVRRIVGSKGYIEITDTDGNVVFSTLSLKNSYTIGEIDFIQKYGSGATIEVSGFETNDFSYNYLVTKSYKNDEGETEQSYMLLDADFDIISSTIATTKSSLTKKEYEYFTYNYFHSEAQLYKYAFQADDSKTYYVILLDSRDAGNLAPVVIVGSSVLAAIALYTVLLVFYMRYMKRHVRRPVNALNDAMNKIIASGEYREQIDYKGYTEFELLTDSYNNLALLLDKSERDKQELERDKQRMLAGLSHDLKTPITVIQGYARALDDGIVEEKDKKKCLELIVSKSETMVELINTFFEYSTLEHPDFSLNKELLDIVEFSRAYLARKYDELTLASFSLEASLCEEQIFCKIDKKQLERVFDNLIGNSVKYNGVETSIFFSLKRDGDFVVFEIGDNGKGLPENMGDEIFQPFVVGEKSRNKQGSGLGLAICKKIVNAHGGTIKLTVPEAPWKVMFSLTLPVADNEESVVKNDGGNIVLNGESTKAENGADNIKIAAAADSASAVAPSAPSEKTDDAHPAGN
jgi:signal transduction histidine kinase